MMKSLDQRDPAMSSPETKRCKKCSEEKPLSEFYRHGGNKKGYRPKCRKCTSNHIKESPSYEHRLAKNAEYRANNIEKRKQSYANWYAKDPSKKKIYNSRYVKENFISVGEYRKRYYSSNADKIKAKSAEWKKQNPERVRVHNRNREAKEIAAKGTHTAADVQQLLVLQKNKCAVCRTSIANEYHVDHVIPLSAGGGNGKDNLQLLCPSCNLSKGAKHPVDFMQLRGMLL